MTHFDIPATGINPYELFAEWLESAKKSEPNDPEAMTVATIGADGMPSARMLLLKGIDERGFVFFTNSMSRKGQQLAATRVAALLFHWKSLRRQVRVEGAVETVSDAESDAYFNSRPKGSRIGAWASLQSQPLDSRATLEARVKALEETYKDTDNVPRPPHWFGYRVKPTRIEFWQDGAFRLHDRFVFTLDENGRWVAQRQYP
ncbi:MAG: pyridoxamine 5'-phosphate oxidase [Proteobacteria bacterium]|nr:pyridoxamine 5'-phosphate oxidase [Pseudomonadota bacterium]